MAENLPDEELLFKYLDKEMTAAEQEEFDRRLHSEPDLQEQLERLQLSIGTVNYYGIQQQVADVQRQLQAELDEKFRQSGSAKIIPMRKALRYTLAIASCIILILVGTRFYQIYQLTPEKVFKESYVGYSINNLRSGKTAATALEQAFAQRNYTEVIQLSKGTTVLSTKQELLIGLSYLELNKLSESIVQFKNIISQPENNYKQDAEYYLALTYIKNKDYSNALTILKKIESDKSHLYHNQVTPKIIREVRWLSWK